MNTSSISSESNSILKKNNLKKDLNMSHSVSSFQHLNLKNTFNNNGIPDPETRMRKLETIVALLTNQNEILIKRVDELEFKNFQKSNRSNSVAGYINYNTRCSDEESNGSKEELLEWKRDIELSIEKISERVASNNSTVLINILEKRINNLFTDIGNIRSILDENVDQISIVKKTFDKSEKSEKLINELKNELSSDRNKNFEWQSDFSKNLSEYKVKLMNQETILYQLDKQDEIINKKIDSIKIDNIRKESNILEEIQANHIIYNNKIDEVYKFFVIFVEF